MPHDAGGDGAVTINVDGDYSINSLAVTEPSGATQANNAGVTLANPGGNSSLTITDDGTLVFPGRWNRAGTNLGIATDLNFTNLNVEAGNRNSGIGQGDRGVYFGRGTFTGSAISVDGTVAFDGAGTYHLGTLTLGPSANMSFVDSPVDFSGVDVTYSTKPGNDYKRSYVGVDAVLASLQLGESDLAPGTYNSASAASAPLKDGGTIDLAEWFVFRESDGVPQANLTVVPEAASLTLLAVAGLLMLARPEKD